MRWHENARGMATAEERAQDTNPDAVMNNIAAQTGLTVKREKQKIVRLVVKKG